MYTFWDHMNGCLRSEFQLRLHLVPDLNKHLQQQDLHKHVTDAQHETGEAVEEPDRALTHCWCKQSLTKRHHLQPGQPMPTT